MDFPSTAWSILDGAKSGPERSRRGHESLHGQLLAADLRLSPGKDSLAPDGQGLDAGVLLKAPGARLAAARRRLSRAISQLLADHPDAVRGRSPRPAVAAAGPVRCQPRPGFGLAAR